MECHEVKLKVLEKTSVSSNNFINVNNTLAASNIFLTAAEISGPMPSPGINVTKRFCVLYLRDKGELHET